MVLTERQKQILSATVKTYILTGEPVGSKALCEIMPVQVSSATVRAVLSDLCEMGFLTQPHTSAGRVPTAMGYRFYVEELMNSGSVSQEQKRFIDERIGALHGSTESLLEQACESLAAITGCAAMLTTPAGENAVIRSVRLIALSRRTIMAVITASGGIIKNRIARCEFPVSEEQLQKAEAALSEAICSKELCEISAATSQDVICRLGGDMLLLMPIVTAAVDAAVSAAESELKLKGESNLLINSDFSGERAVMLLEYLKNRSSVIHMLHRPQNRITVVLGDETGENALHRSGVIITNYKLSGQNVGSIGILGPERMDYGRIIPGVLYFRDALQELLSDSFSDEGDL